MSTHPLYSHRTLKLGTFASNVAGGCVKSTIRGRADGSWQQARDISVAADSMEFEALVPLGRWRGHGGLTDHGGTSLESYTWAAAVAASTQQSGVFSTSHISTVHPLMAAKQGATIDQISGGRFALNLVCGWDRPEMEMFGNRMLSHEERYRCAAEWLHIIRTLWTSEEPLTFHGEYFDLQRARISPQPLCRPCPPVMNAGTSETGRQFAAQHCDIAFVTAQNIEDISSQVTSYKAAAQEHGREIQVWTYATVVQGENEADARARYREYVHEAGDWDCADGQMHALGITEDKMSADMRARFREKLVSGGGHLILGSASMIVDQLAVLSKAGVNGILLSWPKYLEGIHQFRSTINPLLIQAGYR